MEKWTQHFLGLDMQVAEFVIGEKWTPNGHELLEFLRSNQHVAISTDGEANRQCWIWLWPFKTKHRLDYMITRQTDADHGKVRVDYRIMDRWSREYAHEHVGNSNNRRRKNRRDGTDHL